MEKIEFHRFIERYLEGKMQPAETRWFEKELEGNRWLSKELELRRKTDTFVANSDAMDFRKKLQNAEIKHRSTVPVRRALTSSAAQYAAMFIGIAIIASLIVLSSGSNKSERLTKNLIVSFDPGTSSRSSVDARDDYSSSALELYRSGDFARAIPLFRKSTADIRTDFLLGVSLMETQEFKEAIESLQKVISNNDNLYIEEARWRLSLCYIQTNEIDRAILELKAIANSDSKYNKKARRSLRRIK